MRAAAAAGRRRGDARGAGRLGAGKRARAPKQLGLPRRSHRAVVQGERRAGSDRGLPRARRALRLSAAPGTDRGRHGQQRASWLRPRPWRCCCRRASAIPSACRSPPSRAATARAKCIVAQEMLQTMGLRSFTPMVVACPGCGRTTSTFFQELADQHPELAARADAGVARALSRRREHDRGGDGLRGQRARREQARQHRHQPAGLRREPGGAGVRRRRQDRHAEGRRASPRSSSRSSKTTSSRATARRRRPRRPRSGVRPRQAERADVPGRSV